MGPHCTVRPRAIAVTFAIALTLEPIKIFTVTMYNIYSAAGLLEGGAQMLCH